MADNVKIVFEADTKGLKEAESELDKLGKTEKVVAEQFKKDNAEYINFSQKRIEEIKKEEAQIERIRILRKQSFNPEEIKFYNNEIKILKQNIELLGGSYKTVGAGAKSFLKEQTALNQALKQSEISTGAAAASTAKLNTTLSTSVDGAKKAFGAFRTLANIIPGIGISGLILFGYESLIGLFEEFSSSLNENEKALLANKNAIDKLIEARDELQSQISSSTDREAVAQGIISEADAKRFAANEKFAKQLSDLDESRVKIQKDINKELDIENITNIDKKLAAEREAGRRLREFDIEEAKTRRDLIRANEAEISAINAEAFKKDQDEKAKEADKTLKLIKKLADERNKAEREANAEALKDAIKWQKDVGKALELSEQSKILLTEEGSEERFQAEIHSIEALRDFQLSNTELTEQERQNIIQESENKIQEIRNNAAKQELKDQKALNDEIAKQNKEDAERKKALEKEQTKTLNEARFEAENGFLNSIQDISNESRDRELESVDNNLKSQLDLFQVQLDNKQISQNQFDSLSKVARDKALAEERRIKKQAAETDKLLSLFNIAIHTAEGIAAALTIPPPAGEILAATRGLFGAVQAAVVASTPIPTFAKGTKSVQGGEAGKDSVHALVMPEEMIIPVPIKKKYNPILNAIFDEKISPNLLNKMALEGKMNFSNNNVLDQYAISEGMKGALRNGIIVKNFPKQNDTISRMEFELLKRRGVA